jgi:hypothetical protein
VGVLRFGVATIAGDVAMLREYGVADNGFKGRNIARKI